MTAYTRGAYKAEIVAQGLGTSSTNNPQFWLQARIRSSIDSPDMEVPQYERTIYWVITDGTIDFVVEKLRRLGFAGDSFKQLDPNNADHHSFVGLEVDLFCKIEEYDGKEREKWDLSRGTGSKAPNVQPLDATQARQLDALFGKKLKGTAPKSAAKKQAAKKPEPVAAPELAAVADDDEIPF